MGFLSKLLGVMSGDQGLKVSEQLLFDKVIGFRGIVPGVGCSTVLQNVAWALADRTSYNICVLDINFMYPMQGLLLGVNSKSKYVDLLDFSGELSLVTEPINYKNLYLVSLKDRTVVDMLSSKDSELIIDKMIGSLKTFFDIILIDLSHELTNINVHAAIRCNKIFNVADPSLKCLNYLKKSFNTMATLAVNFAKANKVILNKQVKDMVLGAEKTLQEIDLKLLGTIYLSMEIAKLGVTGARVWGSSSSDDGIRSMLSVVAAVVEDIIQKTPINEKYLDLNKFIPSDDSFKGDDETYETVDTIEDIVADEVEDVAGVADVADVAVSSAGNGVETGDEIETVDAPGSGVEPSGSEGAGDNALDVEEKRGSEINSEVEK